MTEVFSILSFPQTRTFTALPKTHVTVNLGLKTDGGNPVPRAQRIQINGNVPLQSSDYAKNITVLKAAIANKLTRTQSTLEPYSRERVYSACRSVVCTHNMGEGLHDIVKLELEKCVARLVQEFRPDYRLTVFVEMCQWFQGRVATLQSMLTYLDEIYIPSKPGLENMRQLAFSMFRLRMLEDRSITIQLENAVKLWLERERDDAASNTITLDSDNAEDRETIKQFFIHMGIHGESSPFEDYYIEITKEYYSKESSVESKRQNAKQFFEHVGARVNQETQRAHDVLPISSWALVVQAAECALLDGRLEWLAADAMGQYIDSGDIVNLGSMYSLFFRVGGLTVLEHAFKAHVLRTVKDIVTRTDPEDIVDDLLKFKAIADNAIETSFLDVEHKVPNLPSSSAPLPTHVNKKFSYALTDAFATGFKARRNKPAELIAKHIDKAMRKGSVGTDEVAFDKILDETLTLYRYTDDKDVFRTFYRKALAKRLLLNKSASDDVEKRVLKKLKEKYDPEFDFGEKMFTDLTLSNDLIKEYSRTHPDDVVEGPGFNVMVLQQSGWPFSQPKHILDLPIDMQNQLNKYTAFYKNNHKNRKLTFDHGLCTATLKATFSTGQKELSVSLFQATILLMFNKTDTLSVKEIQAAQSKMDKAELHRTLQSLACGKKKVLKKVPAGKDIGEEDVFHFNASFTDPRAKIHINSIQAKESVEEVKATQQSIEADRTYILSAAIVRTMKARRKMTFEQLKLATIEAVARHFTPEVKDIKKRIESLVAEDYLERGEDTATYLYVA